MNRNRLTNKINALPRMSRLAALFITINFGLIFFSQITNAGDLIPVSYGGVFTAGSEASFPLYSKNKIQINKALNGALERLKDKGAFSFNLLSETDSEAAKKETADPLTLALIITRDDVASEKYVTPVATINKTFVSVGMVAIIYQTGKDEEGKERNLILYSIPLTGYSKSLEGDRTLSPEEIDALLINNAVIVLEDHLSKRLSKISLNRINGEVTSQNESGYLINKGAVDGLVEGQNISIVLESKKIPAKLVKLEKNKALIKPSEQTVDLLGKSFTGKNIKGLSSDTYQVVSFKISSKKALSLFDEKVLGSQVSQWFSDFMVDRSGLAFFPSKVGGQWVDRATENSFMILIKDGQENIFEVPSPKYPISLELTGLGGKMDEHNSVNEIWIYGAFIQVDVPAKPYSVEHKNSAAKSVVTGMQSFQEKDVMFELIHDLTAKIATELKF